jgi:hypothetical protein
MYSEMVSYCLGAYPRVDFEVVGIVELSELDDMGA